MDKILDKVQKLLALSQNNPNANEAASAAARAQDLINKYNISRYAVASFSQETNREPIFNGWQIGFYFEKLKEEVLWKGVLATGVSRINTCRVYNVEVLKEDISKALYIVPIGTEFDMNSARQLYIYLRDEIERLFVRDKINDSPVWEENYKYGATHVIMERLEEKHAQSLKDVQQDLNEQFSKSGLDIIHVSNAIVTIENKQKAVDEFYDQMQGLSKKQPPATTAKNLDAYAKGRAAGREIDLNNKKLTEDKKKALKG